MIFMGDYFYLKSGDTSFKVFISEVLYVKAEKKYVNIITPARAYFIRNSISYLLETSLNHIQFCRIHKSYIISLHHLTGFDNRSVFIGSRKLPIGRRFKDHLHKKLASFDSDAKKTSTTFNGDVDSLIISI